MTDIILEPYDDPRVELPMLASERESLDSWLEMYRQTLPLKITGLTAEQLTRRSVPPSALSLIGIVRHLAEVEGYWLREVLHGEEVPEIFCSEQSPDGDFDDISIDTVAEDLARYRHEVDLARKSQAAWGDLDKPVVGLRQGTEVNLRWILVHLIEEYARHLGHMDLLREAIDGVTGY